MSNKPRVVVIVVQYNHAEQTRACLESLKGLTYDHYGLIVVDNASRDEERHALGDYLANYPVPHTFVQSEVNGGYAGGNNLGIKLALEQARQGGQGSDYVLILNNDTTVEPDLIEKLLATAESDPAIGIVGPIIDEGERKAYGGEISWLKAELEHNYSANASQKNAPEFLTGACLLIPTKTIGEIGSFDERYFLYFEDADFCLRAGAAGYRLAICDEATIQHQVSASTGALGSALLLRLHYRNAHLFNLMHAPWYLKLVLPLWSFYVILKQLTKLVFMPATRPISQAIIAGIFDFYNADFGNTS